MLKSAQGAEFAVAGSANSFSVLFHGADVSNSVRQGADPSLLLESEYLKDTNLTGKNFEIVIRLKNPVKIDADSRAANTSGLADGSMYYEAGNLPLEKRQEIERNMTGLMHLEFFTFKFPEYSTLPTKLTFLQSDGSLSTSQMASATFRERYGFKFYN